MGWGDSTKKAVTRVVTGIVTTHTRAHRDGLGGLDEKGTGRAASRDAS